MESFGIQGIKVIDLDKPRTSLFRQDDGLDVRDRAKIAIANASLHLDGNCLKPEDKDSAGRRCGKRAGAATGRLTSTDESGKKIIDKKKAQKLAQAIRERRYGSGGSPSQQQKEQQPDLNSKKKAATAPSPPATKSSSKNKEKAVQAKDGGKVAANDQKKNLPFKVKDGQVDVGKLPDQMTAENMQKLTNSDLRGDNEAKLYNSLGDSDKELALKKALLTPRVLGQNDDSALYRAERLSQYDKKDKLSDDDVNKVADMFGESIGGWEPKSLGDSKDSVIGKIDHPTAIAGAEYGASIYSKLTDWQKDEFVIQSSGAAQKLAGINSKSDAVQEFADDVQKRRNRLESKGISNVEFYRLTNGEGNDFEDSDNNITSGKNNKSGKDDLDDDLDLDLDLGDDDLDLDLDLSSALDDDSSTSSTSTPKVQLGSNHQLFGNKNNATTNDVADALGVSQKEAAQMARGIDQYSRAKYVEIRAAERGDREATPEIKAHIDGINSYLEKAPKYDGQVYRGLSFDTAAERDAFLQKVQANGGWTANSMDSWSSNQNISEGFAGRKGVKPYGIIISTRNKSGASIRQLSYNAQEDEVLAGKGARYQVKGTPKTGMSHGGKVGDYTMIEVEDLGS